MPVEKFTVSVGLRALEEVDRRPERRSTEINRSLERYYEIMARCRRQLAAMLSEPEKALVLDAFNGVAFMDPVSVRLAWANVEDAIAVDRLDVKWKVDGPQLVEKLQYLDIAHLTALVDAAEIWWFRVGCGEHLAFVEMLGVEDEIDPCHQ